MPDTIIYKVVDNFLLCPASGISCSPREVKRLLMRAMANAAYRQQRNFGVTIAVDDMTLPAKEEFMMGFVW